MEMTLFQQLEHPVSPQYLLKEENLCIIMMKTGTAVLFLALLAGAQADFWSDLWDGVQTNLLDPIVETAQTAAQELVDTYVPVLGQAAQQLVGEAVQSAGDALTDLVSGKRKRQLLTELGQIIQDGFNGLTEAVQQAVDGVTQTVQGELSGLINGLGSTTTGTKICPHCDIIWRSSGVKSKFLIKNRGREMKYKMTQAVQKMARARGFFDDLTAAASDLFAPAIQQAQTAFNTLVDAATATGAAIVDHGTQLVNNVSTSLQQTYDQILGVAQPYIDDAQTIVDSIQNHFDS
uniref:Uncharacterized protein n=1 Tax=Branchiostoma floridae TaxID=7739 RepID=C3XYC0_BRAFL|eukprot:XP_002610795.1 hypothetical protein BRAFLDRAFT_91587 [Branchiostoma floridae]